MLLPVKLTKSVEDAPFEGMSPFADLTTKILNMHWDWKGDSSRWNWSLIPLTWMISPTRLVSWFTCGFWTPCVVWIKLPSTKVILLCKRAIEPPSSVPSTLRVESLVSIFLRPPNPLWDGGATLPRQHVLPDCGQRNVPRLWQRSLATGRFSIHTSLCLNPRRFTPSLIQPVLVIKLSSTSLPVDTCPSAARCQGWSHGFHEEFLCYRHRTIVTQVRAWKSSFLFSERNMYFEVD